MGRQRSASEQQVAELLRTARSSLGLSVAFLARMEGDTQYLDVVESSVPFLFRERSTQRRETSLCQAILDKKLPAVMPDLTEFPEAMKLPAARLPRIRSYVSVPVVLSDGSLYGTLCAAGLRSDKGLTKRDQALMDVLAHAAAVIVEPGKREQSRRAEIEARLDPVIAAGGPVVVFQPIVELATGIRTGAEALSRFPNGWGKPPDVCFGEAHSIGLGKALELMAIERAVDEIAAMTGYIAINISAGTLLAPEAAPVLQSLPLDRIVLELSEHDPIEDYEALRHALAPLRHLGMRLAIDDVGAGFSSLRHIVLTAPDVIKLDRSIVHGMSTDPVLLTLLRALVEFAHGCEAQVVAEGVETPEDAEALRRLGVDLGQGWYFGRPGPADQLTEAGFPSTLARPGADGETPSPTRSPAHHRS